jgi:transposase
MQVVYARCAAVDVGQDVIAVAVRLPGDGPEGRATIKRTFRTFYGVLAEAARWLASLGVTHVAMEATGIYSAPVYYALVEHGGFEKVLVCNAGHVKNVPGRKTDAEWLVHLLECGLLAGSFIPPAEIKAARDVIRYRARSPSRGPRRSSGWATCCKTPGSSSTRWPPRSRPSPGGR